ncbi:unnamed protein product, partial [Brassica rapa]
QWRSNTYVVDKLWKQVKRPLHEVPMWLIKNSFYGTNMILIMPPKACELNKLENRCSKCFYYKEMAKFMDNSKLVAQVNSSAIWATNNP